MNLDKQMLRRMHKKALSFIGCGTYQNDREDGKRQKIKTPRIARIRVFQIRVIRGFFIDKQARALELFEAPTNQAGGE